VCRNPKASAPFKKLAEHQAELFTTAHMLWGFRFTDDPSHLKSDEALRFLEFIRKRQASNPDDIFAFQHRLDRKGNVQDPLDTSDEECAAEIKSHKWGRSMSGKLGRGATQGAGSIQGVDKGDANEDEDEPDNPNTHVDGDEDGGDDDDEGVIEWSVSDHSTREGGPQPVSQPVDPVPGRATVSDRLHEGSHNPGVIGAHSSIATEHETMSLRVGKGKGREVCSPQEPHRPRENAKRTRAQTPGIRTPMADGRSVLIQQGIPKLNNGKGVTGPATQPEVTGNGIEDNQHKSSSGLKRINGINSQQPSMEGPKPQVQDMRLPDWDVPSGNRGRQRCP
jgi:hypothetical protein